MKDITLEDYVSFELAELLFNKGFNEATRSAYMLYNKALVCFSNAIKFNDEGDTDFNEIIGERTHGRISAPTLQVAMKWLRNMGIVIEITTCWPTNPDCCMIPYCFRIEDYRKERDLTREHGKYYTGYCSKAGMDDFLEENHLLFDELGFGEFPTYESTCDAAIKYCLETLI